MIKLIYSLPFDPIVIAASDSSFRGKIELVSIRSLYEEFLRAPSLDTLKSCVIIDRCGDGWDASSEHGLRDLNPKTTSLTSFFCAYYSQLHTSESVVSQLFHLGTPWNTNSLNAQWCHIENHALDLKVPENISLDTIHLRNKSRTIFTNPNKLYQWQPNAESKDEDDTFVFEKPDGKPFILTKLYDQYLYLDEQLNQLTQTQIDRLQIAVNQLDQIFAFEFGEILLFSSAMETTFGMFSNYPMLSGNSPVYRDFLHVKLQSLVRAIE